MITKLQLLETFTKVVETESFLSAAKLLFVSPSAVTRQINELEISVDNKLINRTTSRKKFQLTSFGELFYHEAKKIVDQVNTFEQTMCINNYEAQGEVTIVIPQFFLNTFIVPNLLNFYKKHPKIKLKFIIDESFPNFFHQNIDLVICHSQAVFNEEANNDIVVKKLFKSKFIICASPEYIKDKKIERISDLLSLNIIANLTRNENMNAIQFLEHPKLKLQTSLSMDSSAGVILCAQNSLGIIQIHDFFVQKELAENKLVSLLPELVPFMQFSIFYRKNNLQNKKIRAVIDYFVDYLKF
jgi:DNA-binding transcriptional LysR family regulator